MDSLVKALNDRGNLFLISLELFSLLKKILSFVNPGSDLFLTIEVFCIEDLAMVYVAIHIPQFQRQYNPINCVLSPIFLIQTFFSKPFFPHFKLSLVKIQESYAFND